MRASRTEGAEPSSCQSICIASSRLSDPEVRGQATSEQRLPETFNPIWGNMRPINPGGNVSGSTRLAELLNGVKSYGLVTPKTRVTLQGRRMVVRTRLRRRAAHRLLPVLGVAEGICVGARPTASIGLKAKEKMRPPRRPLR